MAHKDGNPYSIGTTTYCMDCNFHATGVPAYREENTNRLKRHIDLTGHRGFSIRQERTDFVPDATEAA